MQLLFIAVALTYLTLKYFKQINALKWPTIILSIGWLLSSILYIEIIKYERNTNEEKFHDIALDIQRDLQERFKIYDSVLHAGASMLIANNEFSHDKWRKYILNQNIIEKFPGINGIGFIEIVKDKNLKEWANIKNKYYQNIFNLHSVPNNNDHSDDSQFIISSIEPRESNQAALGLILSSEKKRREALLKSINLSIPTITETITLVQDQQKGPGFLYYVPIYNSDKKHIGWTYAPFISRVLFRNIDGAGHNEVLYTVTIESEDEKSNILYGDALTIDTYEYKTNITIADKKINLYWKRNTLKTSSDQKYGAIITFITTLLILIISIMVANWQNIARIANKIAIDKTAELKKSQAQLINTAQFTVLGEMAGGIAHEINNPLAIIVTRAHMIATESNKQDVDTKKINEMATNIQNTAQRISTIIKGLRTFANTDEREKQTHFKLETLIDDALSLCAKKYQMAGIDIKINKIPNITIFGSEAQLTQAILSILTNCQEAIQELENKWIKIEFEVVEDTIKLIFVDSGKGIAKEITEKMMQPFFTTKEVGKGVGLGLSIAKGIIEAHNGHIWYDDKAKNTTFVIELPISNEKQYNNGN